MGRRAQLILGCALAASLVVNAYSLLREDDAAAATVRECAQLPASTLSLSLPSTSRTKAAAPMANAQSRDDCAPLARRVEELEADLDKHLPISLRFEQEARSEAHEAIARGFLDHVFTDGGKGKGYEVECHERACRVTVDKAVARDDWKRAVQSDPRGAGLHDGMEFGGSGAFYLLLTKEDDRPGKLLRASIRRAIVARAAELEQCAATHPRIGAITLALHEPTRRIVAESSEELAGTPLDRCVRPLVEQAVAAHPVTAAVTSFDPIWIPVGE